MGKIVSSFARFRKINIAIIILCSLEKSLKSLDYERRH